MLTDILLHVFVVRPLRLLIEPAILMPRKMLLRNASILLLMFVFSAIFAPLDVIITRLAVQRNYGRPAVELPLPVTTEGVAGPAVDTLVDLEVANVPSSPITVPESDDVAVRYE